MNKTDLTVIVKRLFKKEQEQSPQDNFRDVLRSSARETMHSSQTQASTPNNQQLESRNQGVLKDKAKRMKNVYQLHQGDVIEYMVDYQDKNFALNNTNRN